MKNACMLSALLAFAPVIGSAQTWFWQNPQPQGNDLHGVSFTDANTGTAVGNVGTILRTTNGGATWTRQTSGTTNGGTTWSSQTSGTSNNLSGVFLRDANTGTAVGDKGTILRSTNGGATWTKQASGVTNPLQAVFFTDANNGTAVGSNGIILHTTDGGTTWSAQISGTFITLYGVSFSDANSGSAVGAGGTILRTTDGGTTWASQTPLTVSDLFGVSFTDLSTGTVVGDQGAILSTRNRATNIGEAPLAVPVLFNLDQNYPNPFNPATTIRYQLLAGSFVELRVFDVLGREVATLVASVCSAGTHLVNWNASDLPSGFYVYCLKAGDFVSTKKMLLLR